MHKEIKSPIVLNKNLPWWTWIVPILVAFLADAASFSISPFPSQLVILYGVPLGIVMVTWWGLRVVPGVYLGFTLGTLLWLNPPLQNLFFYRIADVLAILFYWFFYVRMMKGHARLDNIRSVLMFIIWGLFIPAIPSSLFPMLFLKAGNIPLDFSLVQEILSGSMASIYGVLLVSIPLLSFVTPAMGELGLLAEGSQDIVFFGKKKRIKKKEGLEIVLVFLLFGVQALFPSKFINDYYFLFITLFMLWASIRFGYQIALLASAYVFAVYYYVSWIVNGSSAGVLSLSDSEYFINRVAFMVFSLAGVFMGRIINDLKETLVREHDSLDQLRESEERYRYLVEQASEAIFEVDEEGFIVSANRKAEEMTGHLQGELLHLKFSELFTQESLKNMPLRFASLNFGHTVTSVRNMQCADGSAIIVEMVSKRMENGRYQSILRDVTARIRAEDVLHEYQERLELIFKINPSAMSISTFKEGRFLNVNPAFCRLTGYSVEEMEGHTSSDLSLWIDIEQRENIIKALTTGNEVISALVNVRKKSGEIIPVFISMTVILIKGEKCLLLVGMDISERIHHENALRLSEAKTRALLNAIPDSIFRICSDGRVIEKEIKNDMIGIFKDNPEEDENFYSMIQSRAERMVALEIVQRVGMEQRTLSFSFSIYGKSVSYFEVVVSPSGYDEFVCVVRNVTERHRIEDELVKSSKLESLSILAGGIAHDFNNLLSGLFGYVELAQDFIAMESYGKALESLNKISKIFERAKNLTYQLLAFSKGGDLVKTSVDISRIVQDTTVFLLSGTPVKPVFHFSDEAHVCEVDVNQIGQAIDNVVLNASQAMPHGGILDVTIENVFPGAGLPSKLKPVSHVKISFRDYGTGISKDLLSKIFDPFFTTKKTGTGLGLSTAYSIVKKHNGLIEVTSEENKGSTFVFYLPFSDGDPDYDPLNEQAVNGKGNILVMDDEEFMRSLISVSLSYMGFSVDAVSCGEEAVEKYKSAQNRGRPYDAVILDLTVVNGLGGVATVRELMEFDPNIVAIASSGYSEDPVMASPRSFGFKDAIGKPYRANELGILLNRVIHEKNHHV